MAAVREAFSKHPRLASWAVLAAAMLATLAYTMRDAGLTPRQFGVMAVSTVLLAGLCVWIISWEETDDEPPGENDRESKTER